MHTEPTSAVTVSTTQVAAVRLRPGAEVAARVVQAAGADGRGLLSLAGAVVRARLPPGLAAGERLRLVVVGREGERIVLRLVREESASRAVPASVLAELAESGDGEQLRAALALAGGPIALPGARVLTVEPDGEDTPGREQAEEGAVRLVLHSPSLGALELRFSLRGGVVDVGVVAGADVAAAASGTAPELAASVEAATGLPARVEVVERRGAPPPVPPLPPHSGVERFA